MKKILSYRTSVVVSNKQGINNVSIQGGYYEMNQNEANRNMKEDKSIVLVDVRTPQEYAELHIPGSILIPLDTLKTEAEKKLMDKKAIIYLYCRSGNRSASAAKTLVELGYSKVYNIGGISSWPFEIEKGGSK
jgi:phage shock protein E